MGRRIFAALMSRGPQRGTWSHQIGSILAAIVLGLAFWWSRTLGG
jgi:hypothetical protein